MKHVDSLYNVLYKPSMNTIKELERLKMLMVQLHFLSAKYMAMDMIRYTEYGVDRINELINHLEVSKLSEADQNIDNETDLKRLY